MLYVGERKLINLNLILKSFSSFAFRYHCEDPNCYSDLSRLRGLKYLTWRDTKKLKYQDVKEDLAHSYFHKHANYIFDEEEFQKIVYEGIAYVKEQAKVLLVHDEL